MEKDKNYILFKIDFKLLSDKLSAFKHIPLTIKLLKI